MENGDLLYDLRKINEVVEDMGALQPGLPTPTMFMDTNSNRLKGLFVKHLPEFGKLCHVYVSIDTFSDCTYV